MTALAESALRAIVLAAAMALVFTALRPKRAATRLTGWTIVLYAALAMPVLGWVLPPVRWSLPIVLPAAPRLDEANLRLPAVEPRAGTPKGSRTRPTGLAEAGPVVDSSNTHVASPIADPASRRAPISQPSTSNLWLAAAFTVYLAGALGLLLRAGMGWLMAHRLTRAARVIDDVDLLDRLGGCTSAVGLTAPPRLAETESLVVPITMSVLHPIVVLPATWRAWDAAKLDAVLMHEVAHVARRDALTQWVSLVHRAVFWFSPFAWWLRRALVDLAEDASDEAVLDAGADRATYAETLLGFFADMQQAPRRANWHAVAMARGGGACRRVERILAWTGGSSARLSRSLVAGMIVLAVPVVALTASVRPAIMSLSLPAIDVPAVLPPTRGLSVPSVPPAFSPTARTTPQSVPPSPATTQANPRSVVVDGVMTYVQVRDAQGRPVADLRAEDFRVFEDGVEQKIGVFVPYPASGPPIVIPGLVDGRGKAFYFFNYDVMRTTLAQAGGGRLFVVLIDDMNISPADLPNATRILERIRDGLQDDDLVSIVSTGSSSIETDLLYDRGHVRFNQALARLAATNQPGTQPPAADAGARAHLALKTAIEVVSRLEPLKDRPKTFLYLSGGYAFDPTKKDAPAPSAERILVDDLAALIRASNRSGLTFYTVDPRSPLHDASFAGNAVVGVNSVTGLLNRPIGVTAADWQAQMDHTQSMLRTLAGGGFTIPPDTSPALQRIDDATPGNYLLGYMSSNLDMTRLVRKVEVRVSRPGVQLRYRQEYTIKRPT
jgi:VWFA-related protein